MHKPKKRYTFCYKKKKTLKKKNKYINILYKRDGSKHLLNNIDNLDEQQQAKLANCISKLEKEKQLIKAIKIKEKQQKSPQPQITKIEPTKKKSYECFNVSLIDNIDPLIQIKTTNK